MENKLLAPNGKPSNLNAEQYKLVRSEAFVNWFGDWINDPQNASKIIDDNGEPMVVYHGTNSDFTKFSLEKVGSNIDYGMWGSGFYFSPLRSFSKYYGSKILKLFLNIRNPFVRNPNIQGSKSQFKPVYGKEASLNLRNEILSYNYDGVIQYELGEKNPLTQIIAFEPNQIKLADGTNTKFDSSNDDIRFYDGGHFNNKGFVVEELDQDLKEVYQNRAFKNISGSDFYFSRLNIYPLQNVFTIELPNGEEIGRATLNEKENYLTNIRINENYRRKGLALNLYDFIEYIIGKKLKPSPDKISKEAEMLWVKRNPSIIFEQGGEIDLEIISDRKGILDYLTRNSGRWYQRDFDELNELFNSNAYVEQDDEVVKDLSVEYVNFYRKNPNFKKIPLIIYQSTTDKGFGEGELFRYDFVNEVIISSSKEDINDVKNFKTIPINNICGFVTEKYENKIYGALMHEYGHLVNISKAGYINDIWFSDNYEQIVKNISIYAGEKKAEFLAEVFCLKKIPNFDELDEEKKEFIIKYYDNIIPEKSTYKNGGRTVSQTPAPKKDQVYGSNVNKNSSSKNISSAKLIKFDDKTLVAIKNKVQEHNDKHPDKKINLSSAKAVVRRGFGAYSSSHRPTISGGKPNSRVAWGLARLNAFIYKIVNGKSKSGKYTQDDDLIEELGYKVADYKNGGEMKKDIRCINCGWEWNRKDSELWDMYVCHKCGFDNTTFYSSIPVNNYSQGGEAKRTNPDYLKMFLDL
jgi:hypothetical protein